ncbi:MAG: DUF1643 domain-containing protein [Phycisphaerales bacterium JB059]
MRGRATFDETRTYRYTLHRRWAPAGGRVCFCLLNPSTADEFKLDPTLTRCLGYARRWGFHAMEVVNIFALRSTDPGALREHDDPVGPGNDRAIRLAARRADRVVVGWGAHGALLGRGEQVARLLTDLCRPLCLGLTNAGAPRHPLYLRKDLEPIEYDLTRAGSSRPATPPSRAAPPRSARPAHAGR